jgi:hypothetical protein
MRKAIQLSIPKPCHENWDAMTPKDKGRHCKVCEKTVFDFTSKTDEYIVKSFEQNGKLCGRFKNAQLNRELSYSRKNQNNYLLYVASSLFTLLTLGVNEVYAQGALTTISQTHKTPNQIKGKVAHSILKERVISGTILDENGLPMPGAYILVKGTSTGTQTDFDGNYKLKVKNGNTLVISSIGYKTSEILITDNSVYNYTIEVDINAYDEVIIAGRVNIDSNYTHKKTSQEIAEEKKRESIRKQNHKALNNKLFIERIEAKKLKRQQIRNGEIERTKIGKLLYNITNLFRKRK